MDDLVAQAQQLHVSSQTNSIYGPHPRSAMYKKSGKAISQEKRRVMFLLSHKESRHDYLAHIRNLAETPDTAEETEDEEEEMDVCSPPKKLSRSFRRQIMLSEWMVEVPKDLEECWLMTPCPVGTRCLVIAARHTTTAYYRSGKMLTQFQSHLPGGNPNSNYGSITILDCITTQKRVFYILDVMCWNSHPFYDSEKEFRNYWLRSKCSEAPSFTEIAKKHKHPFHYLPHYSCTKDNLQAFLLQPLPFKDPLDGLLFYHREGQYVPGVSPLCVWLKVYMLPELLQLQVPESLMEDRPIDYQDMRSALPAKAYDRVLQRKSQEASEMQVEEGKAAT